jgi:hypothetical protein
MKSYQPSTPRTAFGFLAAALTVVTFSLSVVAPVALVRPGRHRRQRSPRR